MWIPKTLAVVLAAGLVTACGSSTPDTQLTPPPSYQAKVDTGQYEMPTQQAAIDLGFVAVNDDKLKPTRARLLLPAPPEKPRLDTQKYLPAWYDNNELHPYTSAQPKLAGVVLWAYHSSAADAVNRVQLIEFTLGQPQAGIKPWKYRCSAPLLKQGSTLADFLQRLPERYSYLSGEIGTYAFVMLDPELGVACVRIE